jgi:flavin-dependent dehydrogenase
VILGGGPAGATCATVLADAGRRVVVLERSQFPRHHIGESLMPQTYWSFKRIGMLEKMQASRYVRKESVQFVNASGQESAPFYFSDRDPNEWSVTWQVKRDEFDQLMLDNARQHGAEVVERANGREVLFEGDAAVGVRAEIGGRPREIRARVVVDATGQSSLLSRQLKIRDPDPELKNAAIYAHFRGAHRDTGRNAGATIVLHTEGNRGWFWVIPLADDLTSVGVVGPPSYLCAGRGDDPAATLEEEIAACPGVRQRLTTATRIGPAYVTADFSYRSRQVAGNGWVLIGDAFGFLDPVYSSGVMLALKSGEWAADAICDALAAGDVSGPRLGRFGANFSAGMDQIKQLVHAFYDPAFSVGRFVKTHPQFSDAIVRVLIGDVFEDRFDEMFETMHGHSSEASSPAMKGPATA